MATKSRTTSGLRTYENFEPSSEWIREDTSDTLLLYLPGFKKERLKVQIDVHGNLRVTGEQLINESSNHWRRFRKEYGMPVNTKIEEIRAKFDKDRLYVTLPKLFPATQQVQKPQQEQEPAAAVQPVMPPAAPFDSKLTNKKPDDDEESFKDHSNKKEDVHELHDKDESMMKQAVDRRSTSTRNNISTEAAGKTKERLSRGVEMAKQKAPDFVSGVENKTNTSTAVTGSSSSGFNKNQAVVINLIVGLIVLVGVVGYAMYKIMNKYRHVDTSQI